LKKIILIVLVISISIFVFYKFDNINNNDEDIYLPKSEKFDFKNDVINLKKSTVYEDEYADDAFKSVYELNNLENHEVYRYNDTIHIDLFFNENISRSEISNSEAYIMKLYVKKSEMPMTRIPYVGVLYDDMSWKKVRFNIFINDTLILQEKFANISKEDWLKGNLKIDYYENSEVELPSRTIENKIFDNFSRYIKFRFWGINSIVFEKSFNGNFYFVKLKGNREYTNNKILKIKGLIENKLIADLTRDFKDKPEGFDKSGIVLQIYNKNNKYYEMTYIFDNKKGWIEDNWLNVN